MGKQQNLIYENFAFARCVLKNIMSNKGVIMLRNDLFKFLVLFSFVFVISLVSMVGCGDDDGEGGDEVFNGGGCCEIATGLGASECLGDVGGECSCIDTFQGTWFPVPGCAEATPPEVGTVCADKSG